MPNPIPSTDVADFLDNVKDFDALCNGAGTYTDRFGLSRLTVDEFFRRTGYEVPVAFASGIAVSRTTQTVTYSGMTYHALATAIPFTTTGTFNSAQWELISGVARQEFESTLSGYVKGVSTFTALRALDKTKASFAYVQSSGLLYGLDVSDTTSADDGAYIIVGTDGGRWKLKLSGVPFSPDLIDGQIEIVAGAIRQDTTDRTKWNVISDSLHQALGLSGLVATASGSQITLNYSSAKSKVISLICGPDETFANAYGMSVGASVGTSFAVIKARIDLTLAAEIWWDGSAWQVSTGAGQGTAPGVSVPPNVNISGVSYASGTVNIAHTLLPGKNINVNAFNTRGGAILSPYVAGLKSFSDTGIALHFMNPTTGAVVTSASPDTKMTTLITKQFSGGIALDGTGGTSAYNLDLGNIWFIGIMKK